MAAACATAVKRATTKIFNLSMAISAVVGVLEGDLPWLLYLSPFSCEREKPSRGLALPLLPPRRASKSSPSNRFPLLLPSIPPCLALCLSVSTNISRPSYQTAGGFQDPPCAVQRVWGTRRDVVCTRTAPSPFRHLSTILCETPSTAAALPTFDGQLCHRIPASRVWGVSLARKEDSHQRRCPTRFLFRKENPLAGTVLTTTWW